MCFPGLYRDVFVVGTQALAAGAAGASVWRGGGCPVLDTTGSSQLQPTHRRAQLRHSTKLVSPWQKKYLKKGKKCCLEVRSEQKCERNSPADIKVKGGGTELP